jgi:hypothetical protein
MPKNALRLLVLSIFCALIALPAGPAIAAPAVTNTNDSGPGSLRAAIEGAAPGETVSVPAGTYTVTSELMIAKSLTVSGHEPGDTIVRAGAPTRLFSVLGPGVNVTIAGLTIRDGLVSEAGGLALGAGVASSEANLTLRSVVVTNNRAVADGASGAPGGVAVGGGIYCEEGFLTIADSTISENLASVVGGSGKSGGVAVAAGIFASDGLLIERTTISGNRADARGGQGPSSSGQSGGVAVAAGLDGVPGPTAPARVLDSTISGNVVDASGGPGGAGGVGEGAGVFAVVEGNPFSLEGTTIAGNSVRSGSGGISVAGGAALVAEAPAHLAVVGATISGNSVDTASVSLSGNLFIQGEGVTFADSIVSGGIGPAGSENCGEEKPKSLGFNLDSGDQCGFHGNGDLVNTNPLLGPLQSNGGPTPTMALAANSPAVDKGAASGLTTDQRGVQRPIDFPSIANSLAPGADGSDIGAFELQPVSKVTLGKLQRNKKKGTAVLTVKVPLPAVGKLTLSGKGLKRQEKTVNGSKGTFKFKVVGKGAVKKALRRKGKRKVSIKVAYRPAGNATATASRKAKLIKKHG